MQFADEWSQLPEGRAGAVLIGISERSDSRVLYAAVIHADEGRRFVVAAFSVPDDDESELVSVSLAENMVACLRMSWGSERWEDEAFRSLCRYSVLRLEACLNRSQPEAGMLVMMVEPEDHFFFADATDLISRFCLKKLMEDRGDEKP